MARPKKVIDAEQVATLAKLHCTYDEIAAVVGCSTDTLKRRFADCIQKGREEGKASLRRAQFKSALGGNSTMLIWLGKQHLGQTDGREKDEPTDPREVVRSLREIARELKETDGLKVA